MYMTRILLKRLPTPNIVHGVISAAFPGKRSETANESLWRIDNFGDIRVLLIVSAGMPDLELLVNKIGVDSKNPFSGDETDKFEKTINYEPFLKKIEDSQVWNFRLCANPVEHKKQDDSEKRGKIYALRSVEEQIGWLDRQGEKNGFKTKGSNVVNDSWIAFGKIRIRSVTFDGILTVNNAGDFRSALTNGIGRGKAYGCGLLTVAKPQA